MRTTRPATRLMVALVVCLCALAATAAEVPHPLMQWVKRHPRENAPGKPPPQMGYETSYGYDWLRKRLIRYGGHNQGGGGEQNSEVWTYELDGNTWRAMRPCPEVGLSPLRGAAYDVHHQVVVLHGGERSGHGTVVYDLFTNTWHEMKPPSPPPPGVSQPGFTYDAVHRVFVLFGSQFQTDPRTWVYDLRNSAWRVLEVVQHPPAERAAPCWRPTPATVSCCAACAGAEGLETWALDVAEARWTRLDLEPEPDPSGNRNRVLMYLPDENLFVLENRVKDKQQIWTFRYAEAPPTATQFLDETAGEGTRRYEIVAVDTLGQEGEPSRPVWSRREWGKFYVPYVGAWHQ